MLYRLKDNGYIAYLVGGGVRDLLLDKTPKDFDIGTNARPDEIRKIFRHSRCIGKRFKLVHVYFRGSKFVEVSTFRRRFDPSIDEACATNLLENKNNDQQVSPKTDAHEDDIYGTPQEDAFRRDLTINGLFYNIADFSIIDYVGGMKDLENGIIRAIGDPFVRFERDPVRMMRAIRHAARTGFTIEPLTWQAILEHKDKIHLCSMARVRDEWLKDVNSGFALKWFDLMLESGLFYGLFPGHTRFLTGSKGVETTSLLRLMLNNLDNRIKSDHYLPESLLVASLLLPCLCVMPEWNKIFSQNKLRFPLQEVKDMINEVETPYDFKKSVKDEAAYLIAGLSFICNCEKADNWPRRLKGRADFKELMGFYEIVKAFDEIDIMASDSAEDPQGSNATDSQRKRRRRKKKKSTEATVLQQDDKEDKQQADSDIQQKMDDIEQIDIKKTEGEDTL